MIKSKIETVFKQGEKMGKKIVYILLLIQMSMGVVWSAELPQPKLLYPTPSAIVMEAYRYLGRLEKFSVDAITTSDDTFQGKMLVTFTHKVHIDLQRPDKLHIEVSGDLKQRSFYLDKGNFTLYDKDLDYYGILSVPQNIDGALDTLFERYQIKTSLANILYSDLDRRIPPKNKGYYFGLSEVEGALCYHLGFTNKVREIQLWIEKGIRPLIRKFIIIDKTQKQLPRSVTLLKWNLHPTFQKALFEFEPSPKSLPIIIESASKGVKK